ncbi:uncharacterized protein BO95DRAFT_464264 [Aspergillus brunneoviolaceus CBS 621.78]|uniref:Uncharacterized protein n=1 Tax=Aspergillus brunneoviolaceus CBS 621.78 TaxID=1450534 RepID=A0ACD1G7F9_9EURO|nr:hypothetical protein BO95DRAFT_464264 [Aspergillus brunneoviolaceus CBS 621.78]RAH45195.1 hypothetical protein BO95DRAFT_464264 [Aspergillus brunneoviolaceus CBS 621.78]
MSEVQKPVEETAAPVVAPVTEAPAVTEVAATEPAAAEAPKETPAEATEATPAAPAEEPKADAPAEEAKEEPKKEEVTPAEEGVLGYKAPGLVKGLRFAKRFFYFHDDAVEAKQLSAFHQNEKPAVANPIAAWASQTGKGLLFLTKRAEDKATPAGIFNLSEVSDIAKEGANEFHFKVNGHKHTFQAASGAERDGWVLALETKAAEAKAEKETIVASEGYKAELEKLNKPAVAEPVKKAAEPKEEAAPAEEPKDEKATAKSRSQSRKRASIFGTLLGKKEETEEKKEEQKEEEAKAAEPAAEAPAEAPVETTEAAPAAAVEEAEAPAPATPAPAETSDKKEEEKEEKKAEAPVTQKFKRASLFGNFFQKVTSPSHEKSEKEAAAPAPAPVETPVASSAPQLDNPVEEANVKPIEPETVTAAADAEASKDATPAASPAAAETPKNSRRTSFFGNFGKKKGDSDNEGADGEAKPKGNKLGGIFRKPSKAVKSEVKETKEATEAAPKEAPVQESPAEETAQPVEAPAATEEVAPVNNVPASTPVQAAA